MSEDLITADQVPLGEFASVGIPVGAEDAGRIALISEVPGAVEGQETIRIEPGERQAVDPTPNAIDSPLIAVPGRPQ